MFSRLTDVVAHIRISLLFKTKLCSVVCMYHILSIYPLMGIWVVSSFGSCEYCHCEHGVWISIWVSAFDTFEYVLTSRIAEAYGNSVLIFWGIAVLYFFPQQQCTRFSISLHHCQLFIYLIAILMSVKHCLMVLISHFSND
jgi:hypothetical protein